MSDFNALVGLDIKYLPGWKVNQRVPALNIVDYASSFQLMVPLPAQETSDVIRQVFQERWTSWAGVPREVIVDPARTNVGDALTVPLELAGTAIRITAADAHWQLGKTEVHGGWFSRVLEKVSVGCVAQRSLRMDGMCSRSPLQESTHSGLWHDTVSICLWSKSQGS